MSKIILLHYLYVCIQMVKFLDTQRLKDLTYQHILFWIAIILTKIRKISFELNSNILQ